LDCHSITAAEAVLTLGEIRKHFLPSEPTGAIAAIEQIHASLEGGGLEDGLAKLSTLAEQLSTLAQRVTDLREELLDTENSIQEARFDNLRR
jgi:TolA-binding protein